MDLFLLGLFGGAVLVGTAWALRESLFPRRQSWHHSTIYRKGHPVERL